MKKIISLLFVCILLTGCGGVNYETIDTNRALELINEEGTVIIDVRSNAEYLEGHVEGAVNIPLDTINEIDYDKDTTIILYCATGVRSLEAAKKLNEMGYTHIYNLDGGLINWGGNLEK